MKYKVFVFDWDGTLVDSENHIVSSLMHAAQEMGLPSRTYDENKNIIGLGMSEALLDLYPRLGDDELASMKRFYSNYFYSADVEQGALFEDVLSVLSELKLEGVKLAVATGKSRKGLDLALKTMGLSSFFDIERCADESKSKPDPLMLQQICDFYACHPEQMVMIGDTEYDLEMAANIGMDSIGVSYGVHEVDRLLRHKPVRIIDHFSEILTFIN